MKKFTGLMAFLVGLIVLLAVIIPSYYFMGKKTEETVKSRIALVNKTSGIEANIVEYHRGWFLSHASLDWKLHVPENVVQMPDGKSKIVPAQDYLVKMPLTIHHGPIIFADRTVLFGLGYAKTNIALPAEYIEKFNTLFTPKSIKPRLELSLFINYLNKSKLNMNIPSFKLIPKETNSQFEWKGMKSSVAISSSAEKLSGNIELKGIHLFKDTLDATLGNIAVKYNLHNNINGLLLGDVSIDFPSLIIKDKKENIFELHDFNSTSSSYVKDNLLNSKVQASLDKIVTNGKVYGPGKLDLALRNLDADVLASINQQMSDLQGANDFKKQKTYLSILSMLPKLLNSGPEFEVKTLYLSVPEGKVEGNAFLSITKGGLNNPFELLQKMQGNGKFKLPTEVLRQLLNQKYVTQNAAAATAGTINITNLKQQAIINTDKQINAMLQSGLIVMKGTDYVIEANFENGKLVINGKPFTPAMMQF
jgi:uncharacterized protein YdgA (DUF945 family)